MERHSTLESASGYGSSINVYDSYSLPVDKIEINTINLKVPVIVEWHIKNAIAVYISANIGNDYTTTIGGKWDIAKILNTKK